ncbi:beta-N-acetylglucosaminidase domain-containing protein [Clostridium sp.]|uniref:beta-N-acetylglucosaminidase domain-containing protein n=1 Tax=Clostridium sp. TaxID=1506 RepID=UPI003F3B0875
MIKRSKRGLAAMLAAAIALTNVMGNVKVSAEIMEPSKVMDYEIYPVPQSTEYENGDFTIGNSVNIVYETGVDIYTKNRLSEILEKHNINFEVSTGIVDGKTNILIGINESGELVDVYFNEQVPHQETFFDENLDSHLVYANEGVIGVLGEDADSAFYGVTTLKHVFNQLEDDNTIRNFRIDDYAEVAYRGFIEGYYGNPWSNEDRADLMTYGGDYKLNQYIFAPKDDPYHNSKWRDLYPEAELQEVKKLALAGEASKTRYVYALHPFMHNAMRFNTEENYQADLDVIKAKFTQLIEAGVRQFSILADDAGVPPQGPTTYVKLLEDLTVWLREQQEIYPDLKDGIIFCPNDYMGWGDSQQLKEVNKAGDNISIMATGGRIWGEVSQSFGESYKNNIASEGYEGRAPYYWINWPCSDNSKQHLIMGGNDTFLHPGVDPSTIQGVVLNPMQQAEANKSALFAAADYAWNIWDNKEQADQNWSDSFKYMDHGTAEETASSLALRELSKHMINQNMDGRVTKLEESVELAPKLNAFKEKFATGASIKEDAEALIQEFTNLKNAAAYYKENPGNPRTRDQIIYWLDCWADTTDAAIAYLNAAIAIEDDLGNDVIWNYYSEAQSAFEKSKTYTFWYVDHYQNAEVGVQHIVPFIKTLAQNLSETVSSIVDPSKLITTVITNRQDAPVGSLENLLDKNPETEVVFKNPSTIDVGTYVGVKYNKAIKIEDITIDMGARGNSNDTMQEAKIQYTEDGKTWIDLDGQLYTKPGKIEVEGLDIVAMGVRIIATQEKTNTWLGIKDFTINKNTEVEEEEAPIDATLMRTPGWSVYSGNEASLTDGNDDTSVWYRTHTGDVTNVGDFVGLDLGEVINVGKVHFVVGAGDGDKWSDYKLEYSVDNENWTEYKTYSSNAGKDIIDEDLGGVEARYVRVTNLKQLNKWVKFSELQVKRSTTTEYTRHVYSNVKVGVESQFVDESLTKLLPKNEITLNQGEYIGIKLDRIKDLRSIDFEASNMDGLKLQTSMNTIEWKDVDFNNLEDARYIRLIADKTVTFDLGKFEVNSNEVYEPSLVSAYTNSYGDVEAAFDGNYSTSAKFFAAPRANDTIVYDLGQTINVRDLKYLVYDTEKDYMRDGKIQLSLDGETWVDAITVGDGVQNPSSDLNTKPGDNGYKHGSISGGVVPISHSYIESGEIEQEARYVRMLFTAGFPDRWMVINQLLINNGQYVPTVNNPTFVSNPIEEKGFAPGNIVDGDLTTGYKPNTNNGEIKNGSLTYRISEKTDIKKINIVQSGSEISNAKVMVRTGINEAGEEVWNQIGKLDKSLNEIVNTKYENIFEIKIEWEGKAPTIYEVVTINDYEVPNITDLEELISSCTYEEGSYTAGSFKNYAKALKEANKVLDNLGSATQSSINKAKENLVNAITGLVNISGLKDAVNQANAILSSDVNYTEETLNILNNALQAANTVLANEDATQEEVTVAIDELTAAIEGLEEEIEIFKEHLKIILDEAKKVSEEELSTVVPVVVEEFKAAMVEAEAILANEKATQAEVEASFIRLSEAMHKLEFKKGDKKYLIELVSEIDKLNSDAYIKETWDNLTVVLANSKAVIANENAMQEEVNETYTELVRAFAQLRLKPNKELLEDLINKAEALDSSKYTKETWTVLEGSLALAKDVLVNEDATEEEVSNAVKSLQRAMDGLIASAGDGNGNNNNGGSGNNGGSNNNGSGNNGGSNNNGSGNNNNSNNNNGGKLPQTGGTPAAAVGLFGLLTAAVGTLLRRKNK